MKRLFCILLLLALSLFACTEAGEDGSSGGSSGGSSSTAAGTASDIAKDASELFTDRDYNDDYAEDGSVHITLKSRKNRGGKIGGAFKKQRRIAF